MNLANIFTLLRIASIPFLVILHYLDNLYLLPWLNYVLVILFLLASITDYLDGYLAKKYNMVTKFGIILDPIADKLLVISVLLLLVGYYHSLIVTIPTLIIIIREVVIIAFRSYTADLKKNIPVRYIGKIKTLVQLLAITFLFIKPNLFILSYDTGLILLYIAMILTVFSGILYLKIIR
jgi:CDP-diacylglycerol--glycerol-3-phosphate 3-phosphatidyltransferase